MADAYQVSAVVLLGGQKGHIHAISPCMLSMCLAEPSYPGHLMIRWWQLVSERFKSIAPSVDHKQLRYVLGMESAFCNSVTRRAT